MHQRTWKELHAETAAQGISVLELLGRYKAQGWRVIETANQASYLFERAEDTCPQKTHQSNAT